VAPYKKPERNLPENDAFNTQVSKLRIRSEHAIGFLKGRFHSLKNLRVNIRDKDSHILATYWVAACIGLHSFAMQCEDKERELDSDNSGSEDPFVAEGLSFSSSDSDVDLAQPQPLRARARTARLRAGKAQREKLKAKLLRAQARHAAHHAARSRMWHGLSSGSDSSVV
jgi:DDE superfamily endonuclease